MALAIGVDGAPGGWVAAVALAGSGLDATGVRAECLVPEWSAVRAFGSFRDLLSWRDAHAPDAPVAVDIPIGLPERAEPRPCDRAARARLRCAGMSQSSVFTPPARWMLQYERDYPALRAAAAARREPSLSAQAAALIARIREVDELARARAARGSRRSVWDWLFECHPELAFLVLAREQGAPLPLAPKGTAPGAIARLQLARATFPDAEERIGHLDVSEGLRARPALADCLDAYAALASALRIARAEHEVLGGERDALGVPMRIAM